MATSIRHDGLIIVCLLAIHLHLTAAQVPRQPVRPRPRGGVNSSPRCNILDPRCRAAIDSGNVRGGESKPNFRPRNKCNYQDLYLIPTKADGSCTRPGVRKVIDIDPTQVLIHPSVIKLPGCFVVEFQNVRIKDEAFYLKEAGFFGKVEYQWWNLKEFSQLKCQNASTDGCGGFGNNCYYCNICRSLSELKNTSRTRPLINNQEQGRLVDQFKSLNCPEKPGVYTFRKQFCFNDWSAFDEDGDCQLDFLKGGGSNSKDYRSALRSLRQIGYGTMIGKFKLSHNATRNQLAKKKMKEQEIERIVDGELEKRRASWDVSNGQFNTFRHWYINYRKQNWHKNKYLPWLIYANEMACVKVTFNVCDRPPTAVQIPFNLGRVYRGPKFQCPPPVPLPGSTRRRRPWRPPTVLGQGRR